MNKREFEEMVEGISQLTGAPLEATRDALWESNPDEHERRVVGFAKVTGVPVAVAREVLQDLAEVDDSARPLQETARPTKTPRTPKPPKKRPRPTLPTGGRLVELRENGPDGNLGDLVPNSRGRTGPRKAK